MFHLHLDGDQFHQTKRALKHCTSHSKILGMSTNLTDSIVKSSIFAFTPRQVLLGNQAMKCRSESSDLFDGTSSLNLEQKVLLHQSISHYLELHGFSKTLKKFRSEAQIEHVLLLHRTQLPFSKSKASQKTNDLEEMSLKCLKVCKDVKANSNNQKEQVAGKHSKKDEEDNMIADMENGSKKKKMKTEQSYSDAGAPESKVTSEDKDNDKKCKEEEKKKKKSKSASESLSNGVNEFADAKTVIDETEKRSKDKKKKKDKSSSDGNGSQFESLPMVAEVILRGNASSDTKIVNGEMEKLSEDKKERKNKSSSNGTVEGFQIEDHIETDSKKYSFKTSNEDMMYKKKKKDSKKRRRLAPEEYDVLPVDGKMNQHVQSDLISDQVNIGETIPGNDRLHQPSGEQLNGKINVDFANTGAKSSVRRSQKKQQKGSVEPKLGKAFQRVKADEVVFTDERLQDNSYWAKDGAESGYGAKAEEILGQVRGRDFRHEKTKKKRGTYRGGHIDLQSHSIKFNDSDDDDE